MLRIIFEGEHNSRAKSIDGNMIHKARDSAGTKAVRSLLNS